MTNEILVCHMKLSEIATGSLPVQRIVEDCSGRTSSRFSLAPNKAYADAPSYGSREGHRLALCILRLRFAFRVSFCACALRFAFRFALCVFALGVGLEVGNDNHVYGSPLCVATGQRS